MPPWAVPSAWAAWTASIRSRTTMRPEIQDVTRIPAVGSRRRFAGGSREDRIEVQPRRLREGGLPGAVLDDRARNCRRSGPPVNRLAGRREELVRFLQAQRSAQHFVHVLDRG